MTPDGITTLVVLVAMGLVFLVALLASMLVLGRRQQGREVRELAVALEELRSGQMRRRPVIDEHSPLAVVSDALQRLGQDLSVRWRQAEGADSKLRAVLDGAREIAVVTTDPDWDVTGFSPEASALLGWEESAISGEPISRLFDEDSWREFLPMLARKSLKRHGLESPVTLRTRAGTEIRASLAVRALRAPSGEVSGYVLVIRDDSARARLDDELRASERRYRGLVEGLRQGVMIVRHGMVVYANPAMARMSGTDADRMKGTPWRDFVVSRDVLVAQEVLAGVESGPESRAELRLDLRAGERGLVRPARIRATTVRYEDEPAALVLVEDETLERRSEAELRRSQSRLDAVIEACAEGVLAIAGETGGGLVCATNRALLEMLALRESDVLGRSEGQLVERLRAGNAVCARLADLLAGTTAATGGRDVVTDDEPPLAVEMVISELRDRRGRALGRIVLCRDHTAQRKSEQDLASHAEELRRSRDELQGAQQRLDELRQDLAGRGEELERLTRELETLDEMKNAWLGDLSHDLQAPLVSVRGYTEMVLKGRLGAINDEQRKGLEISLKNVDRLIAMIDNLLAFSRMTREASRMKPSDFELRGLIDDAVATVQERLESRGIEFTHAGLPPDTRLHGDREMLLRVLSNVLSNAVKYNRDGGRIEMVTRLGESGRVLVQIRDTGIGIPARDLERIFERHFRAERVAEAGVAGTGLGLAISRDILRMHGCWIKAESVEGRGSVFSFTLPTRAATAEEREDPVAAERGAEADRPAPRLRIIRHD